jgi:hypothetical protein
MAGPSSSTKSAICRRQEIDTAGETERARRASGCAWHGRTIGGESLPTLSPWPQESRLDERVRRRPGRERLLQVLGDWSGRIAAGEVPQPPPRLSSPLSSGASRERPSTFSCGASVPMTFSTGATSFPPRTLTRRPIRREDTPPGSRAPRSTTLGHTSFSDPTFPPRHTGAPTGRALPIRLARPSATRSVFADSIGRIADVRKPALQTVFFADVCVHGAEHLERAETPGGRFPAARQDDEGKVRPRRLRTSWRTAGRSMRR